MQGQCPQHHPSNYSGNVWRMIWPDSHKTIQDLKHHMQLTCSWKNHTLWNAFNWHCLFLFLFQHVFSYIYSILSIVHHDVIYCAPWINWNLQIGVPPLNSYSFVLIMISNTIQRILHAFRLLIIEHTCSYQCRDFNLISDFVIPAIKSLHCFYKYINLVWSWFRKSPWILDNIHIIL